MWTRGVPRWPIRHEVGQSLGSPKVVIPGRLSEDQNSPVFRGFQHARFGGFSASARWSVDRGIPSRLAASRSGNPATDARSWPSESNPLRRRPSQARPDALLDLAVSNSASAARI